MPETPMTRAVQILLVEDDPADVMLTQEAFEEADFPHTLHVVRDGVEAIDFLNRKAEFADVPRPDVILLDLNMPRMNGNEALAIIKADEALRHIPVIVLTTSRDERDIWRSYNLYANAYVPKPVNLRDFLNVVDHFRHFWLQTAALPHHS